MISSNSSKTFTFVRLFVTALATLVQYRFPDLKEQIKKTILSEIGTQFDQLVLEEQQAETFTNWTCLLLLNPK